jgi:hypothetical protein
MGAGLVAGQVFIPQTNKTSVIGTRQNWVDGFDGNNAKNWVLPQVVLNSDITNYDYESYWYGYNNDDHAYGNMEQRFIDPDRYGSIVYTLNDPLHRETDLIGVFFTAEQMLQQLVKRDHTGQYLDSLGNKVNFLSEADFYPSVLTKVAGKLVDPNHNGWPEITLTFNVKVNLNKAEMNRPSVTSGNGNWYKVDGKYTNNDNDNKDLAFINANIDAFWNGAGTTTTGSTYYYDVRRFVMNLQQNLKGQKWYASSSDYQRAFDFIYDDINCKEADKFIAAQRNLQSRLHGDLYFFTENWLGDLEEGTPYWHDGTNQAVYENIPGNIKYDKFYADKYLIKVCYTANPLDTVVWAQEATGKGHVGKLGKYLYAYKYIEDRKQLTPTPANTLGDPTNGAEALVQNYSHYDMANGELIAWIDNLDTHQVDASMANYTNRDLDNDINENVNIHYNFNSHFAQDLLNRAGRYAEKNTGTKDGYSDKNDNPFSAHVHLNLFEGNCVPAVNPRDSEFDIYEEVVTPILNNRVVGPTEYPKEYILRNEHGSTLLTTTNKAFFDEHDGYPRVADDWKNFYHRPMGVPVMLNNPDFVVRFERPISVEFKTPWQSGAINAVQDAEEGACEATITYTELFRNDGGTPTRTFPMDWRNNNLNTTPRIQFYQGKNTGTFNIWNNHSYVRTVPSLPALNTEMMGFKYMENDRSSWDRGRTVPFYNWHGWYYKPNMNDSYADSWNEVNVVPQVDHMLTNYGGTEGFYSVNASQINLRISHVIDPVSGNIKSTTFKYLNDNINRGAFDIIIPVTVKYAWGDITTTGRWQSTTKLQATPGNYYHNDNMNYIKVHFNPTVNNTGKQ